MKRLLVCGLIAALQVMHGCGSDESDADKAEGQWAITLKFTEDTCNAFTGYSQASNFTVLVSAGTITLQSGDEFYSGPISENGSFDADGKVRAYGSAEAGYATFTLRFSGQAKNGEMSGSISGTYTFDNLQGSCTYKGTFTGQKFA